MPPLVWSPPSVLDGSDPSWPLLRLKALAYVVGVLLKGDGSVYSTSWRNQQSSGRVVYRHRIELKNNSLSFLSAFNQRCAQVLSRRTVHIHGPYADGHAILQYQSVGFVRWWRGQGLSSLKPIIEAFPSDYLRGRYDSDGNVHSGEVTLCGAESQRDLMEFERSLCIRLGMRAGGIRPYGRPGEVFFTGNKRIRSREQKLRFTVNVHDFIQHVGSLAVEWRNQELERARQVRSWTPWSLEARDRAIQFMNERKLSCKEIVLALRVESGLVVPYSTVYSWLNRGTISWSEHSNRSFSAYG